MGILSSFSELMKSSVATTLDRVRSESADIKLEQNLRQTREALAQLRSQTDVMIAAERASLHEIQSLDGELEKLTRYAAESAAAGDVEAQRRFESGADAARTARKQAEYRYMQTQQSCCRTRELTERLSDDIRETQRRLRELKSLAAVQTVDPAPDSDR